MKLIGLIVAGIAAFFLWCLCRVSANAEKMNGFFSYPTENGLEDLEN